MSGDSVLTEVGISEAERLRLTGTPTRRCSRAEEVGSPGESDASDVGDSKSADDVLARENTLGR